MIRLGLRLTLNGGREAAVRLALTAVAVALGVGLLLITLAGINAVNAQNARYAWLATSAASAPPGPGSRPWPAADGGATRCGGSCAPTTSAARLIGRVDVAATGPDSPVPPGIPRLPGPGQFYASPALSRLLRTTPAAQLGDRFPGHQVGTIGPAGAARPELADHHRRPHARPAIPARPAPQRSTSIQSTRPAAATAQLRVEVGINANGIDLILAVVAAALLFPVLIFIGRADPAVGRAPGAAVRRHAAGRRHARGRCR